MIALILCAGKGIRLGKETKNKPKCMVEVGGKPVLERIANHLENYGISKIVVNLHAFPEKVIKYFGQRFLYLYEPIPMGEYNTVSLVKGWFPDEDILVVNGDTLTDFYPYKIEDVNHNGYTYFWKGKAEGKRFYDDNFIDIGTPEGLEKARKKYEKISG